MPRPKPQKPFTSDITSTNDVRVLLNLVKALAPEINILTIARVLETDVDTVRRIMRGDPEMQLDMGIVFRLPKVITLMGTDATVLLKQMDVMKKLIDMAKFSDAVVTRVNELTNGGSSDMVGVIESVLGITKVDNLDGTTSYVAVEDICDHHCDCCEYAGHPVITKPLEGNPNVRVIVHENDGDTAPTGITVEQLGGLPGEHFDENGYPLPFNGSDTQAQDEPAESEPASNPDTEVSAEE